MNDHTNARLHDALAGDAVAFAASLQRVQHIIEVLRSRHVTDEWSLDEVAAKRALDYFRRLASNPKLLDESEFEAALDFLASHGQSIDWVVRGDPSVMICQGARRSTRAGERAANSALPRTNPHNGVDLLAMHDRLNDLRTNASLCVLAVRGVIHGAHDDDALVGLEALLLRVHGDLETACADIGKARGASLEPAAAKSA